MNAKIDKTAAIALLIAARFPLLNVRIQAIAASLDYGMRSPPTRQAALELIKLEPDHFADLILLKTRNFEISGEVVLTTPGNREFHDIDINVVYRYLIAAEYVRSRLRRMEHEKFVAILTPVLDRLLQKEVEVASLADEQCFFAMPQAGCSRACMMKWQLFDAWTVDEAVALSLGKDPDVVSYQAVCDATNNSCSPFRRAFEDLQRRIQRAIDAGQLTKTFSPLSFCVWAENRDVVIESSELSFYGEETLTKLRDQADESGRLNFERKKDTRNRKKIFSLLIVMALDKYGHNIAGKSKANSAISQSCYDFGLEISAETIGDTLRDIVDDPAMVDAMENIRAALLELDSK